MAGRLAATFIHSKLTPLVIVASLLLGVYAVIALPREEEPQIIVPMIDVFVDMPGASPTEVEQRVTRPLEQLLWEVPGVEYLYSTSSPGRAMIVVRFLVGQDEERALVRLNQKLAANAACAAAGRIGAARPGSLDRRRAGDGAHAVGRRHTTTCSSGRWAGSSRKRSRNCRTSPRSPSSAAGRGRSRSISIRRRWPHGTSIRSRCSRRSRGRNVRSTSGSTVQRQPRDADRNRQLARRRSTA